MKISSNGKRVFCFLFWFYCANGFLYCIAGYPYLYKILSAPSLYANTFVQYHHFIEKIFILLFALLNYCTYLFLLAWLPMLLLMSINLLRISHRIICTLAVLISIILIHLLVADTLVFSMFSFHLDHNLLQMIFSPHWRDIFDLSNTEIMQATFISIIITILEIVLAIIIWNKQANLPFGLPKEIVIMQYWLGGFLICFFSILISIDRHNNLLSQQTINLPLYQEIISYLIPDQNAKDILKRYSENNFSQRYFSNEPLRYPLHPMQCNSPSNLANIIIIMVDSLRADVLNAEYMPQTYQFAKQNWQFSHHLSGGNATQPGLFSIFYSLPNNYFTAMWRQKQAPVLNLLLKQNHYLTKILWASSMSPLPFEQTIYYPFNEVNNEGISEKDPGLKDKRITQKAIHFLNQAKTNNKKFYLNLFYDTPHAYCKEQSYTQYYAPVQQNCSRIGMNNSIDPHPYFNRYLNSVRFVDNQIGTLLSYLEKNNFLENSIVIITSDHGQEFNDNLQNYWEHASNFTAAQIHVPMVIHWPKQKPEVIHYTTSSYDLVPTLVKGLFECVNPVKDYSIGQSLLDQTNRLPLILSASYTNTGIVEKDRITLISASGSIQVMNSQYQPINEKPRVENLSLSFDLMRRYYDK